MDSQDAPSPPVVSPQVPDIKTLNTEITVAPVNQPKKLHCTGDVCYFA